MKRLAFLMAVLLFACVSVAGEFVEQVPGDVPPDADVVENASVVEYIATERLETGLEIERNVPETVLPGEPFNVELFVSNPTDEEVSILVVDPVRPGLSYLSAPDPELFRYDGLEVRLLQWRGVVPPNEMVDFSYRVAAAGPGALSLAPATVTDPYGNVYESGISIIDVGCRPNGVCDGGETYLSCPMDCPTGSADDLCDGVADGRVDPDCTRGADPDAGGERPLPVKEPEQSTGPITEQGEDENRTAKLFAVFISIAAIIVTTLVIVLSRKKKKYCTECGATLAADAQYCTECGSKQ